MAAAFWGEDQTGATITNYFDDISGVVFSLPQTSGASSAHFGASGAWSNHPSYFTNVLNLTNATTGNHGGVEIGTGDFEGWYSTIRIIPSIGLTRIANPGPANVLTNFPNAKRFRLELGSTQVVGFLEYNSANRRLALTTTSGGVGNLTLYRDGVAVGNAVSPQSGTRALNSTATGNVQYVWTLPSPGLTASETISFGSSNSTFSMKLVDPENNIVFGDFERLSGGPLVDDYRRAIGFDYRLPDSVTGNNPLLIIGNSAEMIAFGGLTIDKQTLIGYDELGVYILTGAEDGNAVNKNEFTYLHKTTQTIPTTICTIEATGSQVGSQISNNCNFNLNIPTTGSADVKIMAHFVDTSADGDEQALPVTIIDRAISDVGSPAGDIGVPVVMPYQKNAAGGYDSVSFSINSSYTSSPSRQITVSVSSESALYSLLRANDSTLSLNMSVVSVQSTARNENNDLTKFRVWFELNEG